MDVNSKEQTQAATLRYIRTAIVAALTTKSAWTAAAAINESGISKVV